MKKLICKIFGHKTPPDRGRRDEYACVRCGHHEEEHLTEADYQTWKR